nr:hypothetical protein [Morchella crassipes]
MRRKRRAGRREGGSSRCAAASPLASLAGAGQESRFYHIYMYIYIIKLPARVASFNYIPVCCNTTSLAPEPKPSLTEYPGVACTGMHTWSQHALLVGGEGEGRRDCMVRRCG